MLTACRKRLEGTYFAAAAQSFPNLAGSIADHVAVTSRLEDAAIHGSLGSAGGAQTGRSPAMSTHESVGGAAAGGAAAASAPPPAASEEPAAPHVQAYQELISGPLKEFTSKSEALGGVVAQHVSTDQLSDPLHRMMELWMM